MEIMVEVAINSYSVEPFCSACITCLQKKGKRSFLSHNATTGDCFQEIQNPKQPFCLETHSSLAFQVLSLPLGARLDRRSSAQARDGAGKCILSGLKGNIHRLPILPILPFPSSPLSKAT